VIRYAHENARRRAVRIAEQRVKHRRSFIERMVAEKSLAKRLARGLSR
jgi:hypothetical protein